MKKTIVFITLLFLSFTMSSCMSHIEDTNGDDTSLETIDLVADVEAGSYSSRTELAATVSSGDTTYCFSYDDIDYDNISLTYGKITGVEKIHCSDMNVGEELTLTITSTVLSGNLEILVVGPDKTTHFEVEVNTTDTITISPTAEGEYFVVIGGESAEVEIEIVREIN